MHLSYSYSVLGLLILSLAEAVCWRDGTLAQPRSFCALNCCAFHAPAAEFTLQYSLNLFLGTLVSSFTGCCQSSVNNGNRSNTKEWSHDLYRVFIRKGISFFFIIEGRQLNKYLLKLQCFIKKKKLLLCYTEVFVCDLNILASYLHQ